MFKLFSLTVHFKRPDYLTKLTRVGERRVLNVADGLKIAGIRNAEYRSLVLVGRFEFYVFDFELKRRNLRSSDRRFSAQHERICDVFEMGIFRSNGGKEVREIGPDVQFSNPFKTEIKLEKSVIEYSLNSRCHGVFLFPVPAKLSLFGSSTPS